MEEPTKTCQRNGCRKPYKESENNDEACLYHPGKPIFHDTKKGWTCCNKIVFDWDEFQKLVGCTKDRHSDVKQKTEFYKSQTVDNAKKGIENNPNAPKPISIDEFNKKKAEEEKKKNEGKTPEGQGEIVVTASGNYKCANKGCLKEFDPKDPSGCKYHSGNPFFHDLKKGWTCCKTEVWDWDEFMKLPTCCEGEHVPKRK